MADPAEKFLIPGEGEVEEEIGDPKFGPGAGIVQKETVDPETTLGTSEQASEPTMQEVRVKIESEQEEGLELGLMDNIDMLDLIASAEFTSMDTIMPGDGRGTGSRET